MKLNKLYYTFAFLFYLAGVSLHVYTSYESSKHTLLAGIDERLIQSALRVSTVIPENFHHVGMAKNEVSAAQDRVNIKRLSIQAKLSGVKYIYSCIKQGDEILFTSSSATDEELKKNENLSHYFDTYSDASEKLKETFRSKKIHFDEYTDKWGHFRSVFIPQTSSDGQFYVVCADVEVDFVNRHLREILQESIIEILFFMVILIPLFGAYYTHNRRIHKVLESEVQERTRQVKTLLDNADQGFLSFSGDMLIHREYSAKCSEIFKTDIEGKNIAELLFREDEKQKNAFVENIRCLIGDEDELRVENILSLLRSEFTIAKKMITVEYKRVSPENFMLIITDITEKKALEKRLEIEKNKLQMVVTAVENSSELFELLEEYSSFMLNRLEYVKNGQTPAENTAEIYRTVHTFKGLFGQKDFITTPLGLHKLESKLSILLKEESTTNEQLLTLLKNVELEKWLERDLSVLVKVLGENFMGKKDEITLHCEDIDALKTKIRLCAKDAQLQENIIERIVEQVERLKEKPLAEWLASYSKFVEKLAQKLGKHLYPMRIECDKNIFVEDPLKPFVKSLIHVFRNCVDHGIESPEERSIRGKDEKGTIICTVKATDKGWDMIIQDDGAGIDTEKVAQIAVKRGIVTQEEADTMGEEAINLLIFNNSLSTKENITELSGRGVGLAALKHELEILGGTVRVASTGAEGTTYTFFVPAATKEKIMTFHQCTKILNPIAVRTRSFLSGDIGLEVISDDCDIMSAQMLKPYPFMVKIGIGGSVNYLFIMGIEGDVLEEMAKFFIVETHGDAAYELMKEHVACEVANTVLGNAITHFPNKGSGVTITPPHMIGLGHKMFKNSDGNLCATEIKTARGSVSLALLAQTQKGDSVC